MVRDKGVSREIHLKQRPVGIPTENDFELLPQMSYQIPTEHGKEFLISKSTGVLYIEHSIFIE